MLQRIFMNENCCVFLQFLLKYISDFGIKITVDNCWNIGLENSKSFRRGHKTKRRRTKESKSSKKPSTTKETQEGKAPTKGSKTGKSASEKEPVEEPIAEVIINDASDDVVRNEDQAQDTSEPKTRKTLNIEWFKQPPRPLMCHRA
nr:hypothetical protein [Tanacetum cinerariifolium]